MEDVNDVQDGQRREEGMEKGVLRLWIGHSYARLVRRPGRGQ
jgi:hypothetical protein